ncbi:MAG: hypothetical protein IPJ86_06415 [Bacteroidetes bacterium]|nr:hypothetical protein [Bacteroidota bacterium]
MYHFSFHDKNFHLLSFIEGFLNIRFCCAGIFHGLVTLTLLHGIVDNQRLIFPYYLPNAPERFLQVRHMLFHGFFGIPLHAGIYRGVDAGPSR